MKKLFSIFAALLFAGSMMAEPVILDPSTQEAVDGGQNGVAISLEIEGITVSYTGGLGIPETGSADFRVFANKSLTLSAETPISKVRIAGKANKAGMVTTVDHGTVTTGAKYEGVTTKSSLDDPLIVVEDINSESVTISVTKQLRAYLIEVTFVEEQPAYDYYLSLGPDFEFDPDFLLEYNEENEDYELRLQLNVGQQVQGIVAQNGEEIKRVPGAGAYWTVTMEEEGDVIVHFSPEGNPDWEWGYAWVEVLEHHEWEYYLVFGPDFAINYQDLHQLKKVEEDEYEVHTFFEEEGQEFKIIGVLGASEVLLVLPGENDAYTVGEDQVGDVVVRLELPDYNVLVIPEEKPEFVPGFYLVGSFNSWQPEEMYRFAENPEADGEYMLNTRLGSDVEIKVAQFDETGEAVAWYPAGQGNNYVVDANHAGNVNIYFNPQGVEKWKELHEGGFFWIQQIFEVGYFLVGDLTGWELLPEYQFVQNDEIVTHVEYILHTALDKGNQIKVVKRNSDGNWTWFPDGQDNNYIVPDELQHEVIVHFCEQGHEEWEEFHEGGFFFIEPEEEPIEPQFEEGYYLSHEGVEWEIDPDYMLVWNEEDGDFEMQMFVNEGQEFKVYMVENDEIVETYPDLSEQKRWFSEVSGDAMIHFDPQGRDEWGEWRYLFIESLEPAEEFLTCAEAKEKALAGDTQEYEIRGYVTAIQEAWKNGNVSFWMADTEDGGKVFEAYRVNCESAADVPTIGSFVWVKGNLAIYQGTAETAKGGTFGVISWAEAPINLGPKTIAEFLELQNKRDTCILTGVVANIRMDTKNDPNAYNEFGNFDLVDVDDPEIMVYVYGLLTADGQKKKFREMGVDANDTLTIMAVYGEFEGEPQAPNAVYVSHKEYVKPIEDGYYLTHDGVDFALDPDYKFELNAEHGDYELRMFLFEGMKIKGYVVMGGQIVLTVPLDGSSIEVDAEHSGDVLIHLDIKTQSVTIEVLDQPDYLTCAAALTLSTYIDEPTADNKETTNGDIITLRGYISGIVQQNNAPARRSAQAEELQTVWLTDEAGADIGSIQVYKASVDAQLQKGDFVEVEGQLYKYWKGEGNIIIEIKNGTMTKIETPTAVETVATETIETIKRIENGQLLIIRNGEVFNIMGARIQ